MKKSFTEEEAMSPENVAFRRNGNELADAVMMMLIDLAREASGSDAGYHLSLMMYATAGIVGRVTSRLHELGGDQSHVDQWTTSLLQAANAVGNASCQRKN